MAEFVKADIGKLESFVKESSEAIAEFASIKGEFNRINEKLLCNWEGEGRTAYKQISDHILEKITGIEEVLTTINESVLNDLIAQYNATDAELGESNRHAGDPEEGAQ